MYKGNTANVMNNAGKIVRRFRKGQTLTSLMKEYHCHHATMMRTVLSQMSKAEYLQIKHDLLARGGVATRFKPGHDTWNKGLKGIHLSPQSEFKKGCLRGQAARNWRPIGTITIRHDSLFRWQRTRKYKGGGHRKGKPRRWIKIRDDGLSQKRWIPYAQFLWRKHNGPVPDLYIVVHRDNNQMNDAIDNLIVVDRRLHLHRTSHSNPEVVARRSKNAHKIRNRNTHARRLLRQQHADCSPAWYCPACGATYEHRPDRCDKCSAAMFEQIKIPG